jgi:hypothetical protein
VKLNFDVKKVQTVGIDGVRPNPWNPKAKGTPEYKKILRGLESEGQILPIVVREHHAGKTRYEIVDGEQRWTAMKELGSDKIIVYNEGQIDDAKAKQLTIWYEQQVPFEQIPLAKLVKELNDQGIELPYVGSELQEMVDLAVFEPGQEPDEPQGDDDGFKTVMVRVTEPQYKVIMEALDNIKAENDCEQARALELMAADYLAG